jgi:hypothetical protein
MDAKVRFRSKEESFTSQVDTGSSPDFNLPATDFGIILYNKLSLLVIKVSKVDMFSVIFSVFSLCFIKK